MATQRIYLVGAPDKNIRLVRATMRQQAITHVANSMLTCRVATQDDLVQAITSGVRVEQYHAPEQPELIEHSESPAN